MLLNITIGNAGIYALLGYGVVFVGLILLMLLITVMGKAFVAAENKKTAQQASAAEAPVEETPKPTAPGAAGQLALNNVEPKTAAILMAIVADKMQKPINELRFISIKEVTK